MAVWTRRRRLTCGTTRRTGPTRPGSGLRLSGPWSTSWPGTGPCSPTPGSSRPTASTASPPRCPRVPWTTCGPRAGRSPCSARSRPSSSRPTRSTPTCSTPSTPAPPSTCDPGPPLPLGEPGRDAVQDEVDVPHDLVLLVDVLGVGDELDHAVLDHPHEQHLGPDVQVIVVEDR